MQFFKEKLSVLKAADVDFDVFGANDHGYELNPKLSEAGILCFEEKHGISLPEDYRQFLLTVGNGGAGPCYGVFPLGLCDSGHDLADWDEVGLVGRLDQPFLHAEAWNLPPAFWAGEPDPGEGITVEDEDKLWAAWHERLDTQYFSPRIMQGAIPICNEGCALRQWLVVTGPGAGSIWRDLRADHKGIAPLKNEDGSPMMFSDWYRDWLDSSLAWLQAAKR